MRRFFWSWGAVAVAAVMLTAVGVIYGSGIRFGYVFDDLRLVDGTIVLTDPYSVSLSFRSLWTASYPWIHQTFGSDIAWQRGFNVVLHMLNALALWVLTRRLIARALEEEFGFIKGEERSADQDASVYATGVQMSILLWALNPVAVYAVAYLIQRSTLMATGFVVLALLSFIEGMRTRNWVWYGVTLLCYILVLMSKEHGAPMVALLLPLYVWWKRPSRVALWRIALGSGGLAAVAAAWVFIRKGWALGGATEDMVQPFLQQLEAIDPSAKDHVFALSVLNQMWLFFRYGLLWLLPWVGWLSIDIRVPFPTGWWSLQLLGGILFLCVVAGAIWLILVRRGLLSLLGLVFLVPATLYVTEFAYVRIQEPFVLYRSYLWSITLPALLSMVMVVLGKKQWIYAVGCLVAMVFGGMGYERVQTFRDDLAVWRDATAKIDQEASANVLGRWRAPLNLSMALLNRRDNEEALRSAVMADKLGAPLGLAKFNQAAALGNLGKHEQAVALYDQAEREGFTLKPELYKDRGISLAKMGRFDAALENFDRSLAEAKKESVRAAVLLAAGRAANSSGQYDRAIDYYTKLGELQPDLTAVPIGLAYAMYKKGDGQEALRALNQSLAKKPTAEVLHARSYLFYQLGNRQRALGDIGVALTLDPRNSAYLALQRQIEAGVSTGPDASKP
ncbi:tetratricopeptide repeat protein [Tepidimonas fonticaldi]|uniref:tetratricopeptide repeat protein n=1 Tax=Tepidimonas fonticaldi TaxID=1101373 RepID=UPI0009ED6579|nr:tetratricopeptide repeat protein [Tepidimonas fonticaldi]